MERIARELSPSRKRDVTRRFQAVCMRTAGERAFASCLRKNNVSQVIHCAGSVDYANPAKLFAANVELTRQWLAAAKLHGVERFLHISTAFSAGSNGHSVIRESLHADPASEPSVYTKTKRESERLVAQSGNPFLIVRPSILIGDSFDGHYEGKPYGIYQFGRSAERLLSDRWRPHLHVVAPVQPLPLLHQDHFMKAFVALFLHAPPNSIVHVVSEDESLPTSRDVWNLYAEECLKPDSVTFYDTLQQVPLARVELRNRAFLKAVATNVAISSQRWRFDTTQLQRLQGRGCEMPRATLESLSACQRAYIARSPVLARVLHARHSRRPNHHAHLARPNRAQSSSGG
jgi:nucleoside-diphosphate-sugar epimerase